MKIHTPFCAEKNACDSCVIRFFNDSHNYQSLTTIENKSLMWGGSGPKKWFIVSKIGRNKSYHDDRLKSKPSLPEAERTDACTKKNISLFLGVWLPSIRSQFVVHVDLRIYLSCNSSSFGKQWESLGNLIILLNLLEEITATMFS